MSRMSLGRLTNIIYHEEQQRGSMLCAQHALNSLLQGSYFTAPDLAHIAHSFDTLEQGHLDEASQQSTSTNMDDTGFFSVQVMEEALKVWGLNLVRWRSEEMRPYNPEPYKQLGFVLNLQQHWFTLRRFGPASPDFRADAGEGHWFNLNSALPKPSWISRTYLGMVLQQSEDEGYSVFAVVQADPTAPDLALPRTDADLIAATIPGSESTFPPQPQRTSSGDPAAAAAAAAAAEPIDIPEDTEELEDNDMELQAALQASLTGGAFGFAWDGEAAPPAASMPAPAPQLRQAPPPQTSARGFNAEDPVAASMARNRALLERVQREQAMALRENYDAEVAAGFPSESSAAAASSGAEVVVEDEDEDDNDEEDEDAEFRRALAASLEDDNNYPTTRNPERTHVDSDSDNAGTRPPGDDDSATSIAIAQDRVYDDEDQELQAALRASLESLPPGFVPPPTPPARAPPLSSAGLPTRADRMDEDEDMSELQTTTSSSSPPPASEPLSMEEIRRRRMAKFGGT